jgi:hypothetical protein
LKLDNVQLGQRDRILRDILTGYEDLADMHVALSAVVPAAAAACKSVASENAAVAAAAAMAEVETFAAAAAAAADVPPPAAAAGAGWAAAVLDAHQVYKIEDLQQRAEAAEAARSIGLGSEQVRQQRAEAGKLTQP